MRPERSSSAAHALYEARVLHCGLTRAAAAAWLGVHPRTLERQELGHSRVSAPILRALALKAGELGAIHPAWRGWSLDSDGFIRSAGLRHGFAPEHLHALEYTYQILRNERLECRSLSRALCPICRCKRRWFSKRK